MKNFGLTYVLVALAMVLTVDVVSNNAQAQLEEPDVVESPEPKTPITEGYGHEIGFDIMLNNFGFGVGGHFNKVLNDYTEFTFKTGITGLRDVSEQTYQSFFTGNRTIPNKYKRAFGFPFLFGLEQRIFANKIQDSFRLYIGAAAGPAMAFTYPYFEDNIDDDFRTIQRDPSSGFITGSERVNDFFTGWGDGSTEWGYSGELKIGADIGSSFGTRTKVEFGYFFYYFDQGLQIMEPFQPIKNEQGQIVYDDSGIPVAVDENGNRNPHFDAQKYFGTPQIKFTFGGMW